MGDWNFSRAWARAFLFLILPTPFTESQLYQPENYLIKSISHLVDRAKVELCDKEFAFHLFKHLMFSFLRHEKVPETRFKNPCLNVENARLGYDINSYYERL